MKPDSHPSVVAYWVDRASRGNAATDRDGNCHGCGRKGEYVAEGAADGCPVCLAFLDWLGPDDPDAAA